MLASTTWTASCDAMGQCSHCGVRRFIKPDQQMRRESVHGRSCGPNEVGDADSSRAKLTKGKVLPSSVGVKDWRAEQELQVRARRCVDDQRAPTWQAR